MKPIAEMKNRGYTNYQIIWKKEQTVKLDSDKEE